MSANNHLKSVHASRNNISGKGHKGLMNQRKTYEQNQEDDEASEIGAENVLLDRLLATKIGSPESIAASQALARFRAAKVRDQ